MNILFVDQAKILSQNLPDAIDDQSYIDLRLKQFFEEAIIKRFQQKI